MCARGGGAILPAMSTTKRWLAAIGSLLGALAFAAGAAGEHSVLELVSTGPAGGNDAFHVFFDGASRDGSNVFFETDESLVSADSDTHLDVYERAGGQTALLSTGPADGNDDDSGASFDGASEDGTRVFFQTADTLLSADTDSSLDVYERAGGETTLVSTGPAGGNGAIHAFFDGASADGSHVFLETAEPLASADIDSSVDVYERAGGQTTLMSIGPDGGNDAVDVLW